MVMENRIKAETTPTIADLQLANIRTVMVTGDNVELDVFHVVLTLGVPYVCRLAFMIYMYMYYSNARCSPTAKSVTLVFREKAPD